MQKSASRAMSRF